MDQERRRRWVQTQQQKLEDIRLRKLSPVYQLKTENIRLSKTEKIIQLKQPEMLRHQQTMAIDEYISKGDCKLIFLQQQNEDIGFKTFTEMMKTNSSWWGKVDQLNPNESTLKNRLQFNQLQANQFTNKLNRKWTSTVKEITGLINKQQELQQLQKVKKIKLKPKPIPQVEEDEQKEDDNNKQLDPSSTFVKVFWFNIQINEWKPPVREGCSVTYIPSLNKAYMYGGIGNDLFKNFIALNTQTWTWKDIGVGKGEAPVEGRFGHTATLYKQSVIIYGGEKFNNVMRIRECYSDVRMFNPAEKLWTQIKTFGDLIEGRRNHIAQCVGKYFIIYGGINSFGKVLSDVCSLNLETNKWNMLQIENQSLEGVSDAASASLFNGEVKMENPYFSYECNKKKGKYPNVTQEGIYVFGGRMQNGEATNDLRVIQFGFKPIRIIKLKTKGQVPVARYSHSLNYYYNLNALIVYGGRNDSKEENILNDLYVLQLMQMNWVLVQQIGGFKYGKFSHCSISIDSKILIFGGYTQNVYANADIQLIELDQHKVTKMIKETKVNNQLTINSLDLLTNANLKVFKTEYYQDNVDIEQNETNKPFDTMKMSSMNLKTFIPIPNKPSSQLMQEYKLLRLNSKFSKTNIFQSI